MGNEPQPPADNQPDSDIPPPEKRWDDHVVEHVEPRWKKVKPLVLTLMIILVFAIGLFFNRIFISIDSGHQGVMWKRFGGGTIMDVIYDEGMHIVMPWNRLYIYETRIQQRNTDFTVLSKDGLAIKVKAAVRFRPEIIALPELHKKVGPEYVERVVIPQVQSVIRKILGNYDPQEILQSQRGILYNLKIDTLEELRDVHIILDDLLIRELELPEIVRTSIEQKLKQEQLYLAYEYRLKAEQEEAKRKIIEAHGIKHFQNIITSGITPGYLRYKGIQATLDLAKSPNSKILLIGNNEEGLPLIFNADTATPTINLPETKPNSKVETGQNEGEAPR